MSKSSESSTSQCVAWDPRSPATLLIPSVGKDGLLIMDNVSSDNGVGCNSYESIALMALLDSRDTYLQSEEKGSYGALKTLSVSYRKALADCAFAWQQSLVEPDEEGDKTPSGEQQEALELLKLAYSVTQLSETFLLLPSNDANVMLEHYESISNQPGAVTADTIRYLRVHQMDSVTDTLDDETLAQLDSSLQPDQIDQGTIYWKCVEQYVLRGCLDDAWNLLSRHSMRRRCIDETLNEETLDDFQLALLTEDREGFETLRALLCSAPLPGGRNEENDCGFPPDSDEDGVQMDDSIGDEIVLGIPTSAYKLWETGNKRELSGDYPVDFQSHAATQIYDSWRQMIRGSPPIQRLKRRIPQLQNVLSILEGNFRNVQFDTWAEELCSELLYVVPNIRLVDVHVRAARAMKTHGVVPEGSNEEMILSIMKGNAGNVVSVMHTLGGGSGAALPATIMSMFYDLLNDAQILPARSDKFDLKTEFLLIAASSVWSSLATEGHRYLAIRLMVRLLLPHIKLGSDLRITATLVEALEHHYPESDPEADTLLVLCRNLVERKNVRVLDGCVSVCLARYHYYLKDRRPGGAIHWLLTGMELESLVLHEGGHRRTSWQRAMSTGICYRMLVTLCADTSMSLLKGILGDQEAVSSVYEHAKEMVAAQEESSVAALIPAAKMLEHMVEVAGAVYKNDDSIVASTIVSCLEERTNEDDGAVSVLAPACMHWDLLRLAKAILDRSEEEGGAHDHKLYIAAFDARGVQVLLERFTVVIATRKMEGLREVSNAETEEMRLSFLQGLARAFVSENAMKKASAERISRPSVAGIRTSSIHKHSLEKQELVVQQMLDF